MKLCNKKKEVVRNFSGRVLPLRLCTGLYFALYNAGNDHDFVKIVDINKPFYSRRV